MLCCGLSNDRGNVLRGNVGHVLCCGLSNDRGNVVASVNWLGDGTCYVVALGIVGMLWLRGGRHVLCCGFGRCRLLRVGVMVLLGAGLLLLYK